MRRLAFLVAAVGCFVPAVCQGGFVSEFSGHTVFGLIDGFAAGSAADADGTVSFSVYETEDTYWINDWDSVFSGDFEAAVTDQSGFGTDVDTKLVFFYQVVNDDPAGPDEHDLEALQLEFDPGVNLTSWGYVDGFVFVDGEGALDGTNAELGPASGSSGDVVGDLTPTHTGTEPTGFAMDSSAMNPNDASMDDFGTLQWDFSQGGNEIASGGYSTLLFFTLDFGSATFGEGIVTDTGSSNGDIVIPTPVPATGLLFLLGVPAFGVVLRRKTHLAA